MVPTETVKLSVVSLANSWSRQVGHFHLSQRSVIEPGSSLRDGGKGQGDAVTDSGVSLSITITYPRFCGEPSCIRPIGTTDLARKNGPLQLT